MRYLSTVEVLISFSMGSYLSVAIFVPRKGIHVDVLMWCHVCEIDTV